MQVLLAEDGVNVRRSFAFTKHLEEEWKDRCRVILHNDQPEIKFQKKLSKCLQHGVCVCRGEDKQDSLRFCENLKGLLGSSFSTNKHSPQSRVLTRKSLNEQLVVLQLTAFETVNVKDLEERQSVFIHLAHVNKRTWHFAGLRLVPASSAFSSCLDESVVQLSVPHSCHEVVGTDLGADSKTR